MNCVFRVAIAIEQEKSRGASWSDNHFGNSEFPIKIHSTAYLWTVRTLGYQWALF